MTKAKPKTGPSSPATKPATSGDVAAPTVRFKYSDGQTFDLPMADVIAARDRQIQAMVDSDDVELHLAGLAAQKHYAALESAMKYVAATDAAAVARRKASADGAITANRERAKLPEPEALQAELDRLMSQTGCDLQAAKATIERKFGATRQAINAKLRKLKPR